MQMKQTVGRSWHVVSRALAPNSEYEVRTPTATATIRGTAFLVGVNAAGGTNLETTEGVVHAIAGGEEVQVPPGFHTNVQPGGTPPDPVSPAPPPQSVVLRTIDPILLATPTPSPTLAPIILRTITPIFPTPTPVPRIFRGGCLFTTC